MAITIPSGLELLAANALLGHVSAKTDEPLGTLLRRTRSNLSAYRSTALGQLM